MKTHLITAALFAMALSPTAALADHDAGFGGESAAVQVCQDFNVFGPTEILTVVEDGLGDYLVWLTDADDDLWACNASGSGDIWANALVDYDMLDGTGAEMLTFVGGNPARNAERLCQAYADGRVKVIATVDDGLGDYLVWLKADSETFILCNASAEGDLWAFEYVSYPINEAPEFAPAIAEMPAEPVAPQQPAVPVRPGAGQFG